MIWVDARLREELSYCVPKGIPHSVFLGRVVRPGVDPYWNDEDQDKAIAFDQEQAKVCTNCGTRKEEWEGHEAGDPPYVGQHHHCPGCALLEQERKNIPEGSEGHTRAYLVPAELAEDPPEELPDVQEHHGGAERDPGEPPGDNEIGGRPGKGL